MNFMFKFVNYNLFKNLSRARFKHNKSEHTGTDGSNSTCELKFYKFLSVAKDLTTFTGEF